jgi:hypothetical protein
VRPLRTASLIDPGDVLAACNTIDSCFKLFDEDASGRALQSSTFQLNLSRFCHELHPTHP